jgi:hypothetical protein
MSYLDWARTHRVAKHDEKPHPDCPICNGPEDPFDWTLSDAMTEDATSRNEAAG